MDVALACLGCAALVLIGVGGIAALFSAAKPKRAFGLVLLGIGLMQGGIFLLLRWHDAAGWVFLGGGELMLLGMAYWLSKRSGQSTGGR